MSYFLNSVLLSACNIIHDTNAIEENLAYIHAQKDDQR